MYLAELEMACGVVIVLAAYASAVLAAAFAIVVLYRVEIEERVLRARVPGYRAYAARTHRLLPYVY